MNPIFLSTSLFSFTVPDSIVSTRAVPISKNNAVEMRQQGDHDVALDFISYVERLWAELASLDLSSRHIQSK